MVSADIQIFSTSLLNMSVRSRALYMNSTTIEKPGVLSVESSLRRRHYLVSVFSRTFLGSVLLTHHSPWSNCFLLTLCCKNTNCRNSHFSPFSVKGNGIGLLPSLEIISAVSLKRRLSQLTLV